ncbi:MAG: hypothetical protein ACC612_11400 [Methanomethylovorans sp.]|uniref:hypothetical protein n=1 Tax=Methanomethylovorans sp. TaxID=2758717 RepID=UPI0035315E20
MSRTYIDTSNRQTANHADLIQQVNEWICVCEMQGNRGGIERLVNRMDILLDPFKDEIFKNDLEKLNSIQLPETETREQEKNAAVILAAYRTDQTHRALMNLAYRIKFLPASANRPAGSGELL